MSRFQREVSAYNDEARGLTAQAMGNTREFANQALGRASEKMRDLSYGMRDIANRGASSMGDYAQATRVYVAEQPVRSAMIAAAVGAVVAGMIIAMRHRSADRRYY